MTKTTRPKYTLDGPITWELLSRLEPGLQAIERLIQAVRPEDGKPFCANSVWYGGAKTLLLPLVGWGRGELDEVEDPNELPRPIPADELINRDYSHRKIAVHGPWEALLVSHVAYDVAYEHLYEQLPNCRGCMCM